MYACMKSLKRRIQSENASNVYHPRTASFGFVFEDNLVRKKKHDYRDFIAFEKAPLSNFSVHTKVQSRRFEILSV